MLTKYVPNSGMHRHMDSLGFCASSDRHKIDPPLGLSSIGVLYSSLIGLVLTFSFKHISVRPSAALTVRPCHHIVQAMSGKESAIKDVLGKAVRETFEERATHKDLYTMYSRLSDAILQEDLDHASGQIIMKQYDIVVMQQRVAVLQSIITERAAGRTRSREEETEEEKGGHAKRSHTDKVESSAAAAANNEEGKKKRRMKGIREMRRRQARRQQQAT